MKEDEELDPGHGHRALATEVDEERDSKEGFAWVPPGHMYQVGTATGLLLNNV